MSIISLISAVVSFKSKLVRTSIKINRDTIIDHDFRDFTDHNGKRNWSIVVFVDMIRPVVDLITGTSTLAIMLSGKEPWVKKLEYPCKERRIRWN